MKIYFGKNTIFLNKANNEQLEALTLVSTLTLVEHWIFYTNIHNWVTIFGLLLGVQSKVFIDRYASLGCGNNPTQSSTHPLGLCNKKGFASL